jgi:hypothetical protein
MTASVMYNRPLHRGNWSSTVLWGRNRDLSDEHVLNGFLLESTLRFRDSNSAWGRVENVDRTSELLLDVAPEPVNSSERFLARVQAYTAGYDREIHALPGVSSALGGQITFYGKLGALAPIYGQHPLGVVLFIRLSPSEH